MKYGGLILILSCKILGTHLECLFPRELGKRTMVSNSAGVLVFNDSRVTLLEGIRHCSVGDKCPPSPLTFDCWESQAEKYLLRSEWTPENSGTEYLYICWYLHQESRHMWVYYQGPENSSVDTQSLSTIDNIVVKNTATTVTLQEVCNVSSPPPGDKYYLLLGADNLRSQSSACSDDMQATFIATSPATSCATQIDVCSTSSKATVRLNDSHCLPHGLFTAKDRMDCLYSVSENNVTYVMTFTPHNDTVTYACLAYIKRNRNLYVTQQAEHCNNMDIPTNSTYDALLTFSEFCAADQKKKKEKKGKATSAKIAIIVCSVLSLLACIITAVVFKQRRKRKVSVRK